MVETDNKPDREYVAFISYSHRDAQWAKWIQRAIERYKLPAAFANEHGLPRRLGKVFRDREELSTGQNLGDHLTAALDKSENLVVICSPNAVNSQWVSQEIEYFKALGRGDRIFGLLVDGGAEALPPPLLTDVEGNPLEPLAADPRKDADGQRLAKLKIISGILNTNLDQLAQRERARQRQQRGLFLAAANVFFLAVGSALYFEQAQRYEAEQKALERELGIQNVMSMTDFVNRTYDYYDKGALAYVSNEFSGYLERFDDSQLNADQLVAKANALRIVGRASENLGEEEKAIASYVQSRDLYKRAVQLEPERLDLAIEAAFSDFYLGANYIYLNRLRDAEIPMSAYAKQIHELYERNPEYPLLLVESVDAPAAVLKLLLDSKDRFDDELGAAIKKANVAAQNAISKSPDSHSILRASRGVMDYSADAFMKSCLVQNALPYRERSVESAREALALDPRNREYRTNLANAQFALADLLAENGRFADAVPLFLSTDKLQQELLSADEANEYLKRRNATTKLQLLRLAAELRDGSEALESLKPILDEVDFASLTAELTSARLKAELFFRQTNFFINEEQWEQAVASSQRLLETLKNLPESQQGPVQALAVMQKMIIDSRLNDAATEEFPSQFIEFIDNLPLDESCINGTMKWIREITIGNSAAADEIALEYWQKGSRGQAINFFSKQLGIPYPPTPE